MQCYETMAVHMRLQMMARHAAGGRQDLGEMILEQALEEFGIQTMATLEDLDSRRRRSLIDRVCELSNA